MSALRELLDKATPGEWFYDSYATVHSSELARQEADYTGIAALWAGRSKFNGGTATNPADARLIALCPETTALLADMADALVASHEHLPPFSTENHTNRALLARYRALEQKAAA